MTTIIAPIETTYRGYRFRSRLEARWAVFFDAAGIAWEYEPDGYRLDSRSYLPDFWLSQLEAFVEIKPTKSACEEAIPLMKQLVEKTLKRGLIIGGSPNVEEEHCVAHLVMKPTKSSQQVQITKGTHNYKTRWSRAWRQCIFCNSIYIHECKCEPSLSQQNHWYGKLEDKQSRIKHALGQGQRARFEHGEDGKPQKFSKLSEKINVYVAGSVIEDITIKTAFDDGDYETTKIVDWRLALFGPSRHVAHHCKDDRFIYAGPTILEDHGIAAENLAKDCLDEVENADVVFVWLDRTDTIGTVTEIGFAVHKCMPIFIAASSVEILQHFYFVAQLATVCIVADDAISAWTYFKNWQNQ